MDTIKLEQIIREKYGNTGAIIVQKNGVSVSDLRTVIINIIQ